VTQRRDPAVCRAILHQHHADHRAADALLAMLAAARRGLHIARRLQRQARHRVAKRIVVTPAQLLVEVLDREVRVFLFVETSHPLQFALQRMAVRNTPEPLVPQALDTLGS
jgi:predicted naringenin-chalcone synthase